MYRNRKLSEKIVLDTLDAAILKRIEENPGICVADAIRPFLRLRCDPALRYRLKTLEVFGHITTRRTGNRVLLYRARGEEQ